MVRYPEPTAECQLDASVSTPVWLYYKPNCTRVVHAINQSLQCQLDVSLTHLLYLDQFLFNN